MNWRTAFRSAEPTLRIIERIIGWVSFIALIVQIAFYAPDFSLRATSVHTLLFKNAPFDAKITINGKSYAPPVADTLLYIRSRGDKVITQAEMRDRKDISIAFLGSVISARIEEIRGSVSNANVELIDKQIVLRFTEFDPDSGVMIRVIWQPQSLPPDQPVVSAIGVSGKSLFSTPVRTYSCYGLAVIIILASSFAAFRLLKLARVSGRDGDAQLSSLYTFGALGMMLIVCAITVKLIFGLYDDEPQTMKAIREHAFMLPGEL